MKLLTSLSEFVTSYVTLYMTILHENIRRVVNYGHVDESQTHVAVSVCEGSQQLTKWLANATLALVVCDVCPYMALIFKCLPFWLPMYYCLQATLGFCVECKCVLRPIASYSRVHSQAGMVGGFGRISHKICKWPFTICNCCWVLWQSGESLECFVENLPWNYHVVRELT